jgi:hypothetical protein
MNEIAVKLWRQAKRAKQFFESFCKKKTRKKPRSLIEVKAVSPTDFRFYWSRNEIETARIHGPNYFLYLVPASKNGFDMLKVRIIPNPFKRVYLDGKSWLRQEELVSFWPTKVR